MLYDCKNFSEKEFLCPCCGQVAVSMALVKGLQELRDLINRQVTNTEYRLIITSGYRCPAYNSSKKIKGSRNSKHLRGRAADFYAINQNGKILNHQYLAYLASLVSVFSNGGIAAYTDHVHVDVRGKKARWGLPWKKTP